MRQPKAIAMTEGCIAIAERVVVGDDGHDIAVVTYAGANAVARVDLDPLSALHLGADLIDAARRHLTRAGPADVRSMGTATRGGDPHADVRQERDAALRDLAPLLAPGQPIETQARIVIDHLSRYRPALNETAPERQLMAQIASTGLEVPSAERLRRILVKQKS
jgi:hypothetical protein